VVTARCGGATIMHIAIPSNVFRGALVQIKKEASGVVLNRVIARDNP
jgi:hypothetical protein